MRSLDKSEQILHRQRILEPIDRSGGNLWKMNKNEIRMAPVKRHLKQEFGFSAPDATDPHQALTIEA